MPVVVALLVVAAGACLGYAAVITSAHRAIARGAPPETTALRWLPTPVRRFAHGKLMPGFPLSAAIAPARLLPAGPGGPPVEKRTSRRAAAHAVAVGARPEVAPSRPPLAPRSPEGSAFLRTPTALSRGRRPAPSRPPTRPRLTRRERRFVSRFNRRALRKAARKDASAIRKAFAFIGIVVIVALLALALTGAIGFAAYYVVSLFSKAINRG